MCIAITNDTTYPHIHAQNHYDDVTTNKFTMTFVILHRRYIRTLT